MCAISWRTRAGRRGLTGLPVHCLAKQIIFFLRPEPVATTRVKELPRVAGSMAAVYTTPWIGGEAMGASLVAPSIMFVVKRASSGSANSASMSVR